MTELSGALLESVVDRLTRPDYRAFEAQLRSSVPLRELVDVFLEQYQGAPASRDWLRYYLVKSIDAFGDVPIGDLDGLTVARWRAGMPETMRQGAHRALRQVLAAAVRWRWIDHNVATDVPNPMHARAEFDPFGSWAEVMALAHELGPYGPLVIFCVGTACGPRRPSAPTEARSTCGAASSRCAARSPRAA